MSAVGGHIVILKVSSGRHRTLHRHWPSPELVAPIGHVATSFDHVRGDLVRDTLLNGARHRNQSGRA